jgi:uncharacterized protein YkwD
MVVRRQSRGSRAAKWARVNDVLLARCFESFRCTGEWPTVDQLQGEFASAGESVDVRRLVHTMPPALGVVEAERLVLHVQGLSYVPAASPLLDTWFLALRSACERRLQAGDSAYLTYNDVIQASRGDAGRALLVSRLLLHGSWPFSSGEGEPGDEWWRRITPAVLAVRDAQGFSDLLGHEEEPPGVSARVAHALFRDRFGVTVTGGLVLALIVALAGGVYGDLSENDRPGVEKAKVKGPQPQSADRPAPIANSGKQEPKKVQQGAPEKTSLKPAQPPRSAVAAEKTPVQPEEEGDVQVAVGNSEPVSEGYAGPLSALLAPPSACPGQTSPDPSPDVGEQTMVCMVNFARQKSGQAPLTAVAALDKAADRKSMDIIRCDEFSHEACGVDFTYWTDRFGYGEQCGAVGENIAYGTGNLGGVKETFIAWLHSAGHRANILGAYRDIGVGVRVGAVEKFKATVWTMALGNNAC